MLGQRYNSVLNRPHWGPEASGGNFQEVITSQMRTENMSNYQSRWRTTGEIEQVTKQWGQFYGLAVKGVWSTEGWVSTSSIWNAKCSSISKFLSASMMPEWRIPHHEIMFHENLFKVLLKIAVALSRQCLGNKLISWSQAFQILKLLMNLAGIGVFGEKRRREEKRILPYLSKPWWSL